jgi:tetratricopeptide (TPR) repeat protein
MVEKLLRWEESQQGPSQEVLNTLGSVLYRAGRFEEARQRLEGALRVSYVGFDQRAESGAAYNGLFLAMCHYRLGHAAEARQRLAEAVQGVERALQQPADSSGRVLPWWHRQELQLLRREAEELIGASGG